MRYLITLCLLCVLIELLCGGCGMKPVAGGNASTSRGSTHTTVTIPDGPTVTHEDTRERAEVKQPENPVTPATIAADLAVSTGAAQGVDQAIAQTRPVTYAGIGFCVLGFVLVVARAKVPLIPWTAPALAGVFGAGLIAYPVLLNKLPQWAVVALVVGGALLALGVVLYLGWRARWFEVETGPDAQLRLAEKGQTDAAGALALLHNRGDKRLAKVAAAKGKP